MEIFSCRLGCGACCIAPSISSPIPSMSAGKPAGVRCANLSDDNLCLLFGSSERPDFCSNLRPSFEMCGDSKDEALENLSILEELTR